MDLNGLIQSFDYIESARAYAYNKGKKRLIKKAKLADLYYAGSYILKLIKEHGTKENKEELEKILQKYEVEFK